MRRRPHPPRGNQSLNIFINQFINLKCVDALFPLEAPPAKGGKGKGKGKGGGERGSKRGRDEGGAGEPSPKRTRGGAAEGAQKGSETTEARLDTS